MTIIVNLYPCILASSPFVNSSSLDLSSSSAALCICITIVTIRKASLLVWGEKRDSEEKGLLNLVTSGGV